MASKNIEIDEQRLFEVLSHEIRRKIMRLLAQHSFLAYSDLRKELKLSAGVIYHHLQKLQQLDLIRQRETKEYELTTRGYQMLEYVRSLASEKTLSPYSSASPVRLTNIIAELPIASVIHWNAPFVILASLLVVIIGGMVQVDFGIFYIGPYLIPSDKSAVFRISIQFLLLFVTYLALEGGYHFFYRGLDKKKESLYFVGLLLLPALSSVAVLFMWFLSFLFSVLPEFIFWIIMIVLHAAYFLVLINILVNVKRASLDKALFLVLGVFYLNLLFVHFLA